MYSIWWIINTGKEKVFTLWGLKQYIGNSSPPRNESKKIKAQHEPWTYTSSKWCKVGVNTRENRKKPTLLHSGFSFPASLIPLLGYAFSSSRSQMSPDLNVFSYCCYFTELFWIWKPSLIVKQWNYLEIKSCIFIHI